MLGLARARLLPQNVLSQNVLRPGTTNFGGSLTSCAAAVQHPSLSLSQASRPFVTSSKPRLSNVGPVFSVPPLPPPEFEKDGAPRRYPLHAAVYNHGYHWEHWGMKKEGLFHSVYWGDLAVDYEAYQAWLQSLPLWVGIPGILLWFMIMISMFLHAGAIGIKPKRFTVDWVMASKERDRAENSNPVTRYLDRRVSERGWHIVLGDYLPHHRYFLWMNDTFDHEFREQRGLPDLTEEGAVWSYVNPNKVAGGKGDDEEDDD
mmetsp:Transcript_18992/g.47496  ORF Transcript_18992/g.47496 Transcript_18992/m.47496 type:complete len:260 (+) Transcript_18992:124-903(+)|eukprot:CAMPEP_0178993814 /NCGR_PEP_ID=MMETSP0795-20121207/6919_1 /TAXON_ID=88552 /ORGANISM="Amoebophrya sp., Strain Ameob2" /LENGTH=259 /DNA_ID=CAMNT_0020685929 /DNA_START=210 /DNA_END=989 /DNA_ORIENTATION=-